MLKERITRRDITFDENRKLEIIGKHDLLKFIKSNFSKFQNTSTIEKILLNLSRNYVNIDGVVDGVVESRDGGTQTNLMT